MSEIISIFQNSNFTTLLDTLLNPFVSAIIGCLTIFISRNHNRSSSARERLEKVYNPLFLAIEPFLFREGLTFNDVSTFVSVYRSLEDQYYLLITPSLRLKMHQLKQENPCFVTDKNGYNHWFQICKQISKEYDKLCHHSYLPVRNMEYRLYHRQYSSKISMLFVSVWFHLPAIIIFTLILGIISPPILLISYCLFFMYLLHAIIDEL